MSNEAPQTEDADGVKRADRLFSLAQDLQFKDLSDYTHVDDDVIRMVRYLRHRNGMGDGPDQVWIESCYPDLHGAMRLHMGRDERTKMHVECGILANVYPIDIVRVTPDISQDAIAMYEKFFFNLRPYLDHATYIVEWIMPSVIPHGKGDRNPTVRDLRRVVAYFGGWDQHLEFTGEARMMSRDTEDILKGLGEQSYICKVVMGTLRWDVTSHDHNFVVESHHLETSDDPQQENPVMEELKRIEGDLGPRPATEEDDELNRENEYVEIA